MRYKDPLKQILTATKRVWDRPETRSAVRHSFDKMTKCATLALGAEIFSSGTEEKLVPHMCKVRPCPVLWEQIVASLATGAVVRAPQYSVCRHRLYDATRTLANLSAESPSAQ